MVIASFATGGAATSPRSSSERWMSVAIISAPTLFRWRPSSWNQSGWLREKRFQSTTVISGWRVAAARITSFMLEVRRAVGAQRQPENALGARLAERLQRRLDRVGERILAVVVADLDDDRRPDLDRGEEVDERERPHALVRAAVADEPPADGELEVEVDPVREQLLRGRVVGDRGGDRVADERDALRRDGAARTGLPGRRRRERRRRAARSGAARPTRTVRPSPPWRIVLHAGLLVVARVHDPLAQVLGVVDAEEAEPVGALVAGRVEVDRADLHDPVDGRLLDRDVLDPVDVRRALRLREDPAADVEALRRDRVLREEALDPADRDRQRDARDQDGADQGVVEADAGPPDERAATRRGRG